MILRRTVAIAVLTTVAAVTVAGCTSGSDGKDVPTATVTTTASASSAAPTTAPPPAPTTTAAGTTSAAATTSAGGGAGGPGLCTPTVATFRVTEQDGASEHFGFGIQVTNASGTACVTTGYPGVALLDASGRQIEQAARTTAGYLGGLQPNTATPPRITLAPGETATARVEGQTYDVADEKDCGSSPALLFTLPDNTDSTTLTTTTPVCPGLQIHPLLEGTTGSGAVG